MRLKAEDIRRFAARDWAAPERLARRARAALPTTEKVRLGIELYEAARGIQRGQLDDDIRHRDLECHIALRALLTTAAHVGAR